MKKRLLITILIFMTFSFVIYLNFDKIEDRMHKFNFNFKIFLIEDEEVKNTIKIKEIKLNDDRISEENISKINTTIQELYDNLGNREYFFDTVGDPKKYYSKSVKCLSEDLYNQFVNNENKYLRKTFNDIYSIYENGYYKTNLLEIKIDDESNYIAIVEILSIKENKTLMSEKHKIVFNNDLIITEIDTVQKLKAVSKSEGPLLIKNIDKMNALFIEDLRMNFSGLNNKYLYENYMSVMNNEIESEEKTKDELLKEVQLQKDIMFEDFDFDKEVLDEIFMISEGEVLNYKISEYSLNKDKTIYLVNFVHENELYQYNVEFNRIINEVVDIKKVVK